MKKPAAELFLLDLKCPRCLTPYRPAASTCFCCGRMLPAHPEPPEEK